METSVRIQNILSQINKLDYKSRLSLAEQLIKQLKISKKESNSITHDLTELNSLGSEIWENLDIDKYVEQERE
ncbi:hypothetical protein [Marivirga sp.]|uniref:hypothetical protein n=1 Tax=Marivirga sp. TaxID=2018662 RepID=UPI003DA71C33